VIAVVAAVAAGAGAYLLFTATALGWRGRGPRSAPHPGTTAPGVRSFWRRLALWPAQAGLADVPMGEFAAVVGFLGVAGAAVGWVVFASPVPALVGAVAVGSAPVGLYRNRRRARLHLARDEWPRLLDELRLRATTLGRSLPQALFEVGATAPAELRPAFAAAQREWLISTDFGRSLDVLSAHLGDPTADLVCETLLVAHELGGTDLGPRLDALAEDRRLDVASRRDARARQAGVRFARRFVLVVPLGMAAAGSLIGTGRQAYGTPLGQVLVVVAMSLTGLCWVWAGRYLRFPEPNRVFARGRAAADLVPADAGVQR
jgi:tight adherence protein B